MRLSKPVLAAAVGLSLVAAACGSSTKSTTAATTSPTTAGATTAAPVTTAGAATTVAAPTTAAAAATTVAGATTTTAYVLPKREAADLVIWADNTRAPVLTPLAAAFSAKEGVKVVVQEVPADKIKENLPKVGPSGEGPDIVVGAHDWLGSFVSAGAVAPLDLGDTAKLYSPVSIKAFNYEGKNYGLPYAIENIALIRNTDLVPEAPKTFEDLEKVALELKAAGKVEVPLAIQQGPGDPYHNFPLFTALGGYIFKQNEDGSYDPKDLGIDSPGGIKAAEAFAAWSKSGLISKDVTYDVMVKSFSEGKAPFAITGPWAVNDKDKGFKSKVKYVVEPIPPVAGGTPKVFVGVQGFMVTAFSKNASLAKTFLLDYVGKEDVQIALAKAGGRAPAMTTAFETFKDDADLIGFGKSGQQGQPMPAIPAMNKVWDSWKDAYSLTFSGSDPAKSFQDAAAAIRKAVAG
jgi:arabinogalactan oligomer / maltooligosaccharide transport system substrate-binding protein